MWNTQILQWNTRLGQLGRGRLESIWVDDIKRLARMNWIKLKKKKTNKERRLEEEKVEQLWLI